MASSIMIGNQEECLLRAKVLSCGNEVFFLFLSCYNYEWLIKSRFLRLFLGREKGLLLLLLLLVRLNLETVMAISAPPPLNITRQTQEGRKGHDTYVTITSSFYIIFP